MQNPISPYEQTPEGIRAYQENEPYPDWQELYEQHMPDEDTIIDDYLNLSELRLRSFDGSFDKYKQYVDKEVRTKVNKQVSRGTYLSWPTLKRLVWIRDGNICDVCKAEISKNQYDCGHVVDRACGGSDRLDNLVVMCRRCNQKRKGLHLTKEAYYRWRDSRVWEQREDDLFKEIMANVEIPPEFDGYAETLFAILKSFK